MSELQYYIIDTETTGLKANYHEVTEIGIIRAIDRVQLHRCVRCSYPERASFDALKITKKTMADLSKGYNKSDVILECNKFFQEDGSTPGHRVIVAHNASFDRKFLHAMWEDEGLEFPADLWLDTIALTKKYAKDIGINITRETKFNLHASCDLVGIKKIAEMHNAKVDSRNCYLLHKKLVQDLKTDYLPFIKNHKHIINSEDIDFSILED